MLVKLFGIGDLIAASSIVMLNLDLKGFAITLGVISVIYLGLKGIIFLYDFASLMDIFSAIVIVLMIVYDFSSVALYLFAFWLLQKGVRSLL